ASSLSFDAAARACDRRLPRANDGTGTRACNNWGIERVRASTRGGWVEQPATDRSWRTRERPFPTWHRGLSFFGGGVPLRGLLEKRRRRSRCGSLPVWQQFPDGAAQGEDELPANGAALPRTSATSGDHVFNREGRQGWEARHQRSGCRSGGWGAPAA